ncbi:TPA: hypothetical protein ACPFPT_001182 [Escherichia coli]|uniref:hypothetical protein n=1 Tax=Escherichia coli TaxID=562 RepID=UPI0024DED1E7|nr:hypothetical protein [Escherichia coli]MDK2483575.1 hypothetical protein [Escherichia coli]
MTATTLSENNGRGFQGTAETSDDGDVFVEFGGGNYEFETSAGWHDKRPFPTRKELSDRKTFGEDAERLANNKWMDKFIAEAEK